jgi:hypothetical protein
MNLARFKEEQQGLIVQQQQQNWNDSMVKSAARITVGAAISAGYASRYSPTTRR